jgi:hypothetical protein
MPTFIKMVAKLEEPAGFFGDDFRAVALFGEIGLLLTLNAVGRGAGHLALVYRPWRASIRVYFLQLLGAAAPC